MRTCAAALMVRDWPKRSPPGTLQRGVEDLDRGWRKLLRAVTAELDAENARLRRRLLEEAP